MPKFLLFLTVKMLISVHFIRLTIGFGAFDQLDIFFLILKFIYGHIWNVIASDRCAYAL